MAFTRDHGQCCVCLPLKLGVGLICMFVFGYGCFSAVSMFKSVASGGTDNSMSIDLQSGGYNPNFFRLSGIVGVFGIFTSFVGLLGVYDDKPGWIRCFLHYLQFMVLCSIVVFAADLYTLSGCEGFGALPEDGRMKNPAMLELSTRGMCYWGRLAYILGFAIQFVVLCYMLYNVWKYCTQIELNPPYPIDFGFEKYDTASRWKFYGVNEPEEIPMFTKGANTQAYDATEAKDPFKDNFGPDGVKSKPSFAPDGMRGPAYIRAMK